jgi:hypothetical protein
MVTNEAGNVRVVFDDEDTGLHDGILSDAVPST